MAQVVRNTPLAKGQSVVLVHEEFPSDVYAWRRACADAGARVKVVPPPAETGGAEAWSTAIEQAIDADTAAVTIGNVHWTDGTLFDLERIGGRAREMGAAFVVDGSQSVGAVPFDIQRLQPDALLCPAYKWLLGPYSIGVAYFGPRYHDGVPIEETWLVRDKSEDFAGLVRYQDRYRPGAIRYDVGETSNWVLMPMLAAGLRQVLDGEPQRIASYGRALTRDLRAELRENGYGVPEDHAYGGHFFGIRAPAGTDIAALQARLRERGVYVSVRGSDIRISVHVFNDTDDLEALRAALLT